MNNDIKVFGIAGWSGSGKTTLLSRLLPELCARGVVVVTVKYVHHSFDIFDKDHITCEWREAGASEVMYVSDKRWALWTCLGHPTIEWFGLLLGSLARYYQSARRSHPWCSRSLGSRART